MGIPELGKRILFFLSILDSNESYRKLFDNIQFYPEMLLSYLVIFSNY